jgi:hypothetical protein
MPRPNNPNTAAATAAVIRRAQERQADKLRAAGWTCTPPPEPVVTPEAMGGFVPGSVAHARNIATWGHRGQVDKAGKPYIDHPRRVAERLYRHGDTAVVAGWLHDVVEDTADSEDPITLADLAAVGFSPEVVSAVDSVTRRPGETYMDMIRRAAADPIGRLVKLADNADNSDEERLVYLPREDAEFLRTRYAKARTVLLNP